MRNTLNSARSLVASLARGLSVLGRSNFVRIGGGIAVVLILAGLGVPTHLVTPVEWKRAFRIGADKREARLIASRLFPTNASQFARSGDDGRAEAALLALFGSQQNA